MAINNKLIKTITLIVNNAIYHHAIAIQLIYWFHLIKKMAHCIINGNILKVLQCVH